MTLAVNSIKPSLVYLIELLSRDIKICSSKLLSPYKALGILLLKLILKSTPSFTSFSFNILIFSTKLIKLYLLFITLILLRRYIHYIIN